MDRLPLYERLRSVLRERIESGELRPGDAFPSESELIAEHAISRITVRRAIAELQREGLVTTRQGAGTFVADPARANAQCLLSFTSDVLRRGHSPGAELLAFDIARGPASPARQLGLPADARLVHVKRVAYRRRRADLPVGCIHPGFRDAGHRTRSIWAVAAWTRVCIDSSNCTIRCHSMMERRWRQP